MSLLPMLAVRCIACARPWTSTVLAYFKHDHCPFCGSQHIEMVRHG